MNSAKLVWITPDAEKLIGKIARVSNPANEDNPEVEKLIRYLIQAQALVSLWDGLKCASSVETHLQVPLLRRFYVTGV